jgi:hypothetical protein
LFQVAHREGRTRFEVFEYVTDWLVSEDTQTGSQQKQIPDADSLVSLPMSRPSAVAMLDRQQQLLRSQSLHQNEGGSE